MRIGFIVAKSNKAGGTNTWETKYCEIPEGAFPTKYVKGSIKWRNAALVWFAAHHPVIEAAAAYVGVIEIP